MKYKYNVLGLDCSNCAKKIEERLSQEADFLEVILNFSTSKLSFYSKKEVSISRINQIISEIEPGVKVSLDELVEKEYKLGYLILALACFLLSYVLPNMFSNISLVISYILLLYKPFQKAFIMLVKSHTINENMLITISCIGAYLVNSKAEGVMVASLYLLGKILEEKAIHKSRSEILSLLSDDDDFVSLKVGDEIRKVVANDVKIGDVIVVLQGEKIPLDGEVISGESSLDTSFLTGESEFLEVQVGDKVLSGCVNTKSILEIKVNSIYINSTVAKILDLVNNASGKKAHVETTVTKFSKIYTPLVLITALLTAIFLPFFLDITYKESIYRSLTFLVIACPCAIAISIPLSYFTGIGVASLNGILIKGSNYLDNLSKIDKIILDKTGTLTNGTFQVEKIDVLDKNYTKEEIIDLLIKGETFSNHPIAKSILALQKKKVSTKDVLNYQELSGMGITYQVGDKKIKVGNQTLCGCKRDDFIHVNVNNSHVASLEIKDGIKESSEEVVDYLLKNKIDLYMATGDKKEVALEIAKRLNIPHVLCELLPTDKYTEYEKLKTSNNIVAFVGDGVNDAPVIKRSDIGISMGSMGSDAAIGASDVVIMNDDLKKIPLAIEISRFTGLIIKQNLILAISIKVGILLLSLFGLSTMWFAVFADTGVTVLTILNTLRIMYKFRINKKN